MINISFIESYRDKLSAPVLLHPANTRAVGLPPGAADDPASGTAFGLDESDAGTANRIEVAVKEINRLKAYNPSLAATYDYFKARVQTAGADTVKAILHRDEPFLSRQPDAQELLEVIVRTDGSRPSFAVKNGGLDLSSSPVGEWASVLGSNRTALEKAFKAIGRIEHNGVHIGTGFLVSPTLVLTNRHVLQRIATTGSAGIQIKPNATIDFGREHRGVSSLFPHRIRSVVFCTGQEVHAVDHNALDLALLQVEPIRTLPPLPVFNLSATPAPLDPYNTIVYVIGYPGMPSLSHEPIDLVDLLFGTAFGCKRLSPGKVIASPGTAPWTLAHDATTTAGSSGSVILARSHEGIAVGLHYGGSVSEPRQNWGHLLSEVIRSNPENSVSGRSLYDCLLAGNARLA